MKTALDLAIIDGIGKESKHEFILFDTLGDRSQYNGAYLQNGNRILISLDAEGGLLTRAASHEQTHFLRYYNVKGYERLKEKVIALIKKRGIYDTLKEKIASNGYKEDAIEEEMVCDALFSVYDRKFIKELAKNDPKVAEILGDTLDNYVDACEASLRMFAEGNELTKELLEEVDFLKEINEIFKEELAVATQKWMESEKSGKAGEENKFSSKDISELERGEFPKKLLINGIEREYNGHNPLSTSNRANSKNYSSIKWVYDKKIFSIVENKMFMNAIEAIRNNKSIFPKVKSGDYMIQIENKLVFTDGDFDYPNISKIIEFMSDSAERINVAKGAVLDAENRRQNISKSARFVSNVLGDGFVVQYTSGADGVYEWGAGARKGKTRRAALENYIRMQDRRGNASKSFEDKITSEPSSEDGGFSMPKFSLKDIKEKYKDVTEYLVISEDTDSIFLKNMVVKKNLRNNGIGQNILDDIIGYADSVGKNIYLTPTSEFGTKSKLEKWYRKNGFVKNTDLRISESLVRESEKSGKAGEVKFSIKHTKELSYEQQMDAYFGNKLNHGDSVYLGNIIESPEALGLSSAPFVMNQSDIKKSMRRKHGVKEKIIRNLPNDIKKSVMFIDRGKELTIITDNMMLDTKNQPSLIIAGVHKDVDMDGQTVNLIKSVYPLDNLKERIQRLDSDLIITNKNRADEILAGVGIQTSERTKIIGSANVILSDSKSNVNKFSTKDSEYLSLAKNPEQNEAELRKMVDEAAKNAGYSNLMYHGSKSSDNINVFRDWQYFTENKAYAERYAGKKLYESYVKINNLFDTRNKDDLKIFNEARQEYGLSEVGQRGLPDWTDGYDLSEFIDENELDYDAIVLDEGGDMVNGKPVYRGDSYVIRKSNQIKSADLVTYDDNGNIIPLSERFNKNNDDIRYSIREDFREEFERWDKKNDKKIFEIGTTSDVLQSIGVDNRKITWDSKKIIKIMNEHPEMTDEIIKQVPDILENPIIVMKSKNFESRITMFGEVYSGNKPILAVLELSPNNRKGLKIDEIKIASAYSKNNAQSFIDNSEVLYLERDKKRISTFETLTGLQLPVGGADSINSIPSSSENVNRNSARESDDEFYTPDGIEVVKNPSSEEYRRMYKEQAEKYPWLMGSGEPMLRYTYDEDGNEYYWASMDAMHYQVEPYINNRYNTRTSQQYKWFESADKDEYPAKYSTRDSDGNILSEKQIEYFKDSKVRDENGNLLKVYHGTDSEFTIFDRSKSRANMDIQGNFFSPYEIEAYGYGENVSAFYLNITNPASESEGYKALKKFVGQNNAGIKAREYLESLGYDGVANYDEYIAFYPEQIKLIDNTNPTSDFDIRYSFRGENSALTERDKNNLSIAKEMYDRGDDSEKIRLATGWFNGYDGKWRNEIDDSKAVWNDNAKTKIEPNIGDEYIRLPDLVKMGELYEYYPELKDVRVYIAPYIPTAGLVYGGSTSGIYMKEFKPSSEFWRDMLTHELQHIIQNIEGFASGSSQSEFSQLDWGEKEYSAVDKRNELADKLYAILRRHGVKISKEEIEDNKYGWTDGFVSSVIDSNYFLLSNLADSSKRTRDIFEEYYEQVQILNSTTPYGQYMRTAGEIEAYDVQARRRMNEEQRKNTRPNIDRTDVVFADGGESYSIGYTTNNIPVAIVENNILDGVPKSQWIKRIKNTITEKFSNGVPISGRLVKVNKISKNEFVNSKYSRYLKSSDGTIYADKFKTANNLDDVVLASTNYINEDLKHTRSDSIKEFARGDVLIRVGEKDYSAKVIIGLSNSNSMVLYDVVDFNNTTFKLKKKTTRSAMQNAGSQRNEPSSNNSISNSAENVNKFSTKSIPSDIEAYYNNKIAENRELIMILNNLGEDYKNLSGKVVLDDVQMRRMVIDTVNKYNSKISKLDFNNKLRIVYDYMANTPVNLWNGDEIIKFFIKIFFNFCCT